MRHFLTKQIPNYTSHKSNQIPHFFTVQINYIFYYTDTNLKSGSFMTATQQIFKGWSNMVHSLWKEYFKEPFIYFV